MKEQISDEDLEAVLDIGTDNEEHEVAIYGGTIRLICEELKARRAQEQANRGHWHHPECECFICEPLYEGITAGLLVE